jgi:hypothetical protein
MKECVFFDKIDGKFCIKAENGKLKKESAENSYIKHNLLCFGRADQYLIAESANRNGSTSEYTDQQAKFSKAWVYYLEGRITERNLFGIVTEFNKACDRDFKRGLFQNKISLKSVSRLDKSTLLFRITIGGQPKELKIQI